MFGVSCFKLRDISEIDSVLHTYEGSGMANINRYILNLCHWKLNKVLESNLNALHQHLGYFAYGSLTSMM